MGQYSKDQDFVFEARQRIAAMSAERPRIKGVTIDKPGTHIMDDGFSIEKTRENGWVVKVSIADLPSLIPDGHALEFAARKHGDEHVGKGGFVERLFPHHFLDRYVSLRQGEPKPAITFRIHLDKDLNVTDTNIFKSMFLNRCQMSTNDVYTQIRGGDERLVEWTHLAYLLQEKSVKSMVTAADKIISEDRIFSPKLPTKEFDGRYAGDVLVHEMMRLANQAAANFMKERGLVAPYQAEHKAAIKSVSVSKCFAFDQGCSQKLDHMVHALSRELPVYVRLTSPMRHYRDYLTLKILERELDGKTPNLVLSKDARNLTEKFNQEAAHKMDLESYRRIWAKVYASQAQTKARGSACDELHELCARIGLKSPLVTQREIMMDGRSMYFAAFNHSGENNKRHQTDAIGSTLQASLETAAARMIMKLRQVYPDRAHGPTVDRKAPQPA